MQKDKTEKVLEDFNDVFADIYNTLLFEGNVVNEEGLNSGPLESIYKSEWGKLREQRRDVLKVWSEGSLLVASLGIENQSAEEKEMPVRIMGYDYANYRSAMDSGKLPTPVITIVLNFGERRWNAPKSLHELMQLSEGMRPYVQDYYIRVFDIAWLEDEVIERFTSDFKVVAQFFKNKRLGCLREAMAEDASTLKHVEATLDLLRVFTGDNRYAKVYTEALAERVERGEEVYMCEVIDMFIQEGMEKGIEQGIEQGICESARRMLSKGFACEEVALTLDLDLKKVEEVRDTLQIPE